MTAIDFGACGIILFFLIMIGFYGWQSFLLIKHWNDGQRNAIEKKMLWNFLWFALAFLVLTVTFFVAEIIHCGGIQGFMNVYG